MLKNEVKKDLRAFYVNKRLNSLASFCSRHRRSVSTEPNLYFALPRSELAHISSKL